MENALSFLKMHPALKTNKFYPFKKIRTVEPPDAKSAKGFLLVCLDPERKTQPAGRSLGLRDAH